MSRAQLLTGTPGQHTRFRWSGADEEEREPHRASYAPAQEMGTPMGSFQTPQSRRPEMGTPAFATPGSKPVTSFTPTPSARRALGQRGVNGHVLSTVQESHSLAS